MLFLTLPVKVASAERSPNNFVKDYLKNTMSQQGLSSVSIISIENEVAKVLDVYNLIIIFGKPTERYYRYDKVLCS